jgi:hypothetical protein
LGRKVSELPQGKNKGGMRVYFLIIRLFSFAFDEFSGAKGFNIFHWRTKFFCVPPFELVKYPVKLVLGGHHTSVLFEKIVKISFKGLLLLEKTNQSFHCAKFVF